MSQRDEEIRSRMESRLCVLDARLAAIQEILREPEDEDLEEQAVDLDDDLVLERLWRAGRDEAALLRAAIEKIDAGRYGRCIACGRPIAEARLRALPEASHCLRCAQRGGR